MIEIYIRWGIINISTICKIIDEDSRSEVFQIKVEGEKEAENKVDLLYIQIVQTKRAIMGLIENYKPNKTVETEIKMKVIFERWRKWSKEDKEVY